ncbi:MAG: hypothetical protein ACLGHN_04180 [Bacteriovoracia bacterium]
MQKFHLPHVILPAEFLKLLKSNLSVTSTAEPIFEVLRPNKALYSILDKAFQEFNDGRGLEKTMAALGWSNFRDRTASVFIYKTIYGNYPSKTSMDLVEDIKELEARFVNHSVHGYSRVFLLGFYLRLANLQMQRRENNKFLEVKVPEEAGPLLKLTQGRSEKIDWLILILMHLLYGLGDKMLMNALVTGKKFDELYSLLSPEYRKLMMDNLLAYGLSIQEPDIFLYDKI